MLRKIFGLLIFPILGASVHTYAQEEYDQQIFQMVRCQIPLRHPPRRPVRGYPPDFRRIPGSIFQQAGRRGVRHRRAAGQIRRTARGTSRHVQDAGCQEFCLCARLCENGFCIHLYAGLRLPLPRRPDPEGDCLGAEAMPEDSPAAPDGGDRPLAGGFPPARSA